MKAGLASRNIAHVVFLVVFYFVSEFFAAVTVLIA